LKRIIFTSVAIILWIAFLVMFYYSEIEETLYLLRKNKSLVSDQKLYFDTISLVENEHVIYQNSTINVTTSLRLADNARLELFNSTLIIAPHYDNLFTMDITDSASFSANNSRIISSEGAEHYCRLFDNSSLEVSNTTNEGLNYLLCDAAQFTMEKSTADILVASGAEPAIIMEASPYVSLTYELIHANVHSLLPGGEFVKELDVTFIGSLSVTNSYIQSIGFIVNPSVNLFVEDCRSVGITVINEISENSRIEGFKKKPYRDQQFRFGSSSVRLKNSVLDYSVVINNGEGDLYLSDCDISTVASSNEAVVIGQGIRTEYVVLKDDSTVILHDSTVSSMVDIGDRANLFVENSVIADYIYSDRTSDLYFYIDGEKSTRRP
jgi:hypothetical protein